MQIIVFCVNNQSSIHLFDRRMINGKSPKIPLKLGFNKEKKASKLISNNSRYATVLSPALYVQPA
jgi:hypothetical protein